MKKICLVGLSETKNFGDPILLQSTEYLINEVDNSSQVKIVDFEATDMTKKRKLLFKIRRKILKSLYKFGTDKYWNKLISLINKTFRIYYEEKISEADAVIFAGGGIVKFKYEELGIKLALIIKICEEKGIPVMLNAVGVEGYSKNHPICQLIKIWLNSPVVKIITTRDDIDTLKLKYKEREDLIVAKVPDTAWWADVVYKPRKNKTKKIGLGLIRYNIFEDNGIKFSNSELEEFWVGIINELKFRKIDFELFTNGIQSDKDFINNLIKKYPSISDCKIRIPSNPEELVNMITSYERILSSRMHTSIVAYAVGTPSMSIIWNNKILMFLEQISHSDRALDVTSMRELSPENIVEKLENVRYLVEDDTLKKEQRTLTKKYLKVFMTMIK